MFTSLNTSVVIPHGPLQVICGGQRVEDLLAGKMEPLVIRKHHSTPKKIAETGRRLHNYDLTTFQKNIQKKGETDLKLTSSGYSDIIRVMLFKDYFLHVHIFVGMEMHKGQRCICNNAKHDVKSKQRICQVSIQAQLSTHRVDMCMTSVEMFTLLITVQFMPCF